MGELGKVEMGTTKYGDRHDIVRWHLFAGCSLQTRFIGHLAVEPAKAPSIEKVGWAG